MAATLPGFEYDIFISYRHHDNLDGWVTDFVQNLEKELKSTLKESLTVYFDQNPHDGLLDTHVVDKSLEGKLKCLIFIPILSQTYCDPKSFAWQHEFCAFQKLAKEDRFGRDIKLSNGNVASRILVIRIHELDREDKAIIETEINGVVRGIDFIYRESGVNRPLKPSDHRTDNQNKTDYRNQVNKVANAIKELVNGMQYPKDLLMNESTPHKVTEKPKGKVLFWAAAIMLLLAIVSFGLFYFGGVGTQLAPNIDRSIAVLPFVDMSPEKNQEYLGDGLAEDVITALSRVDQLKVIGRTSSFQFKGEKIDLREIGKRLGVATILEGSVMKSGNTLRITAQLINVSDGVHIWSERFDRPSDDLFAIHDEISRTIAEKMKATALGSPLAAAQSPTSNPEAYNYFVQGRFLYESNFDSSFTEKAAYYFKEAIRLDSTFALPWTYLSMCYWRRAPDSEDPSFKLAKHAAERAVLLDPTLSIAITNMAEILDNEYDLVGAKGKIDEALRLDPDNPYVLRNAGRLYTILGRHRESIAFLNHALQNDPIQTTALGYLVRGYFMSHDFGNAIATTEKSQELFGARFSMDIRVFSLLELGQIKRGLQAAIDSKDDLLMAAAYYKSGQKSRGQFFCDNLIKNCRAGCAYFIAIAYAYGDEREKALTSLEKAYNAHEKGLIYLNVEPAFEKYHDEPRFRALVEKMNFPE